MSDVNEILKSINNPVRRDILHWLKSPQEHFNLEKQLVDTDVEGVCVSIIQEKSGLSQIYRFFLPLEPTACKVSDIKTHWLVDLLQA